MQRISSSLSLDQLAHLLVRQTDAAFPDGAPIRFDEILPSLAQAQARLEHCFCAINKFLIFFRSFVFINMIR